MSTKIYRLEIENVKRVKAVKLEPAKNGLTVIGGKNNQGKTSVLDAIAWALGGDRYRPTDAARTDSVIPPSLHIVLDNGLIVKREGKNSDLKVIDPNGGKGGQQLLNEFIEHLALNLPKFINSSNREKADILLKIIGVGEKLAELERKEQELYNRRRAVGQIADQRKKYAAEMTYYPDAPKDLISVTDLIRRQQDILAKNGENQRKRERLAALLQEDKRLIEQLEALNTRRANLLNDIQIARKSAMDLLDESTAALERDIADIETVNLKVRANLDKEKAEDDARELADQYHALTGTLEAVRRSRLELLQNANLPLPGLSVEDGELLYNGRKWDCMSGSEQLKVSTAIVRKLNPKCGFVLLDKLEQMDGDTLREFGQWLEAENLQAIATRVSTGGECAVVIEDGYAVEPGQEARWKAGVF